jgi:hypothetical protein
MAPLDVVSAIGTVLAAGLAAWALLQSGKASERALNALRDERRLDFELDLLMELADLHEQTVGTPAHRPQIGTRLALLPPMEFPVARSRYTGRHVDEAAGKRWEGLQRPNDYLPVDEFTFPDTGATVAVEIREEFRAGTRARLATRPGTAKGPAAD